MADKFRNKFRIQSTRLKNWDYGRNAAYFITICTAERNRFFGEIINKTMNLSEIGIITEQEWINSIEIRPDMNLSIGEFAVMPDHFHAIILIDDNPYNSETDSAQSIAPSDICTKPQNQFGPQSKNLASIVRGFKSAVTSYARKNDIPFNWQKGYYEHIIKNKEEFQRISKYIQMNVANWKNKP